MPHLVSLKELLDSKVEQYNQPHFIESDPIFVPHQFATLQDREIMGFFAAIFAWGTRKTIISKSLELAQRMDNAPYDFVRGHTPKALKALEGFKHRTFTDTDLLYCVDFLHRHYAHHHSLETAFFPTPSLSVEEGLNHFHRTFFASTYAPKRTQKHIAAPFKRSACKRLNKFLRWFVRDDNRGVDFGLWKQVSPAQLICPLDLHVQRTAIKLGLLSSDKGNWQAAVELTSRLRRFDPLDPVKYDFALFGLSLFESNKPLG